MQKRLFVFMALALAPLFGACSKSKACATYHACCKTALLDAKAKALFDKKTRCYHYEDQTSDDVCTLELGRARGELGHANLAIPAECN